MTTRPNNLFQYGKVKLVFVITAGAALVLIIMQVNQGFSGMDSHGLIKEDIQAHRKLLNSDRWDMRVFTTHQASLDASTNLRAKMLPTTSQPDRFCVGAECVNVNQSNSKTSHSQLMSQRLHLLRQQCERPEIQQMMARVKADDSTWRIGRGRLINCRIPKVGTTFTKKLSQEYFSTLVAADVPEFNETRSYFLVREPYSRLLSAYIDKIVSNNLWWNIGGYIISKFRPNATEREISCGSDTTFSEFVKFLIFSQETLSILDPHFQPINQQCDICETHYDFIGHLETIADDMDYILRSVNIPVPENLNFDNAEDTIEGKCKTIVFNRDNISECVDFCGMMKTVWWTFHVRGLISRDIPLPVSGKRCSTISGEDFAQLALQALKDSSDMIDRRKQKREALVELFSQVPLEDRLRLRELYLPDFDLFGYESTPPDIFPELNMNR